MELDVDCIRRLQPGRDCAGQCDERDCLKPVVCDELKMRRIHDSLIGVKCCFSGGQQKGGAGGAADRHLLRRAYVGDTAQDTGRVRAEQGAHREILWCTRTWARSWAARRRRLWHGRAGGAAEPRALLELERLYCVVGDDLVSVLSIFYDALVICRVQNSPHSPVASLSNISELGSRIAMIRTQMHREKGCT